MSYPKCAICDGAGWFLLAVPLADKRFGQLQKCNCKPAYRLEREAAQREDRLSSLKESLGYLAGATFQTFETTDRPFVKIEWEGEIYTPPQQRSYLHRAIRICMAYVQSLSGWLYLYGPVGSGKTHLAAAIANSVLSDTDVTYASAPGLLRYIRAGFNDHSADARLEAVQDAQLLLLDDIGSEHSSNWSEALLFDLLNERYLRNLPTVLTSNVLVADLSDRVSSRITALTGKGGLVAMPLSDYRVVLGSRREVA